MTTKLDNNILKDDSITKSLISYFEYAILIPLKDSDNTIIIAIESPTLPFTPKENYDSNSPTYLLSKIILDAIGTKDYDSPIPYFIVCGDRKAKYHWRFYHMDAYQKCFHLSKTYPQLNEFLEL